MSVSYALTQNMTSEPCAASRNGRPPLRIVLVDDRHSELVSLKQTLNASGLARVVAESASTALAASLAQRHEPDALFLGVNQARCDIAGVLKAIRRQAPGAAVVLLGPREGELILRCFREGADEYLPKPLDIHDLASAVERLREKRLFQTETETAGGKVIGVWGGRGGCGTTTIASNLAFALAQREPTALIDLHLNQGDMAVHLNLQPNLSLGDLLESDERIDSTLIESVAMRHESGTHVFAQPMNHPLEQAPGETLETMIHALRRMYAFTLVDLGHDYSAIETLISRIDAVCLIAKQDLATLYVARRKIAWLAERGFEKERVAAAVNAYHRSSEIDLKRIAEALGRPTCFTVRRDERTVTKAINQGAPLRKVSRWCGAARDIERMAKQWTALLQETNAPARANTDDTLPALLTIEQPTR